MHELFTQVLGNRDLSRAGDLFSVSDTAIVNDLTQVLTEITSIASLPDYANNDNDQSVVEICVTRVTSCIRETGSVEQHCEALVNLLESCLHHNLQPSARDEDPPHAKICSDIISCIFLNYSKKSVMERALPIAVKFLHKGNKELSRNMASYLSLAAIDHATLLSPHVQPIMDSIISGNYPLCRVLAQIYEVSHEPLQGHTMALVSLLPLCDNQEKLALLNLFSLIAKNTPALLEASVPQLCEYLNSTVTAAATLQVFLQLAEKRPTLLVDHVAAMKLAAHKHPHTVCLAAQVIAAVGKLSKDKAQDALNFVLEHLPKADRGSQSTLLREATLLCSSYPVLFTDKVLAGVRQRHHTSTNQVNQTDKIITNNNNNNINNQVNQTSGGVTIVKVGGNVPTQPSPVNTQVPPASVQPVGYTRRAKLGDSRSTGRLHTATNTNTHRSMTRLNIAGGSVGGLHKSMTRLSSSQQINSVSPTTTTTSTTTTSHNVVPTPPLSNSVIVTGTSKWGIPNIGPTRVSSGGVTVTTISPPRLPRPLSQGPLTFGLQSSSGHISAGAVTVANSQITINPSQVQQNINSGAVTVNSIYSSPSSTGHISVVTSSGVSSNPISHSIPVGSSSLIPDSGPVSLTSVNPVSISGPTTVTSRRNNNTSVTILNANNPGAAASQRMSVFEPYPMRDTVQHFCEKHLDKIKAYMDKVSVRIPPPAKCTIEERRAKKLAKLHFACQTRGQHCLYSRTFFTMRTRNPRIWIHLMFIALQARSPHALSSRDASVSSLKHCWDMLKCENKTFLTLVTSAFPCAKDQEILLNELRHSGFFDVFQLGPASMGGSANQLEANTLQWGCFLCTHPERAVGFLRGNTQPVIEGQLKEKKGKWRLFRRWRTRYFTLSGAHLSCRGSSGGESIDVNQIRSVKVSRGARNIPKAFEIFTGNQSLIFKPKDGKNAEEWVQCLSIVVAHSHAREIPVKSNSLPARGISNSKIPI